MDALADARRAEVYRRAVLDRRLLITRDLRELLLPELVARKFSAALDEVADGGGPEAREQRRGALCRDDAPCTGQEIQFSEGGVDLDARFDDIKGWGCAAQRG